MIPSARHQLLDDALLSEALTDSLAATRRAARHTRIRRRTVRVGIIACMAIAAGWFLRQHGEMIPEAPVVATGPVPAFILIATASEPTPTVVRTTTAPPTLIVSTRDTTGPTLRTNDDELFALAGPRPAALHHLPDGSARWMWLDLKRPL